MSIRDLWRAVTSPSTRFALGTLIVAGGVAGAIALALFDWVVHETSSDAFCLTCHADDVGREQAGTVHFDNPTGVRVTCEACHIPQEYLPKLVHKARAGVNDVFHQVFLGTISTPEKFEAHRMQMATRTWAWMNENDSRNCRHCHDESAWILDAQSEKARQYHGGALARGKTCIDCHKGIAHQLPKGIEADEQIEGIDF